MYNEYDRKLHFIGALMMRKIIIFSALMLVLAMQPAQAIVERDLQVTARILNFIEDIEKGPVKVAIIYDEASAQSVSDAHDLEKLLSGKGLMAGQYTLMPEMVDVNHLDQIDTNLAYVSLGMHDSFGKIADVAATKHIFTFTKDFSCLEEQKCVLALETQPDVKIEISDDAAVRSGLAFGMALRMMVKMKD